MGRRNTNSPPAQSPVRKRQFSNNLTITAKNGDKSKH